MAYPNPLLTAINDGALLDMRFKFAQQLLMHPHFAKWADIADPRPPIEGTDRLPLHTPASFASLALDIADALFAEGEKRGWVEPLPTSTELPPQDIAHVKRSASAQVIGQLHAQRVANAEASSIAVPQMTRGLNG